MIKYQELAEEIQNNGKKVSIEKEYKTSVQELQHFGFYESVLKIYHEMGGQNQQFPVRIARETLLIDEKLIIVIDDHSHFNRYRLITLRSGIYSSLIGVDAEKYRRFCRMHEKECLKSGLLTENWANAKSIEYFGQPADPGDFFGNGSPGWKLKAFEDFMLDIIAMIKKMELIRISCYDTILQNGQLVRISKLLESRNNLSMMGKYLTKKINHQLIT